MKAFILLVALSFPVLGFEPRWLTNSIRTGYLKVGSSTYTNAAIRRASEWSVIVRHDGGFFSAAITNLPKSIVTNLVYVPPKEVMDFVNSNPDLDSSDVIRLVRGEVELSAVVAKIEAEKKESQEEIARMRAAREAENKELERKKKIEAAREERADSEFQRKNPALYADIQKAIAKKRVMIGMRYKDVKAAWGSPDKSNDSISTRGTERQLVYGDSYVYLNEDGIVTYIQTSR